MKAASSKSKTISTGSLSMIKAGGKSGHGPNGSSQSYAKGSSVNMTPRWNPMKLPANTYGIKGC